PRSTNDCSMSYSATSNPEAAATWAIPWPIVPAPITAIRSIIVSVPKSKPSHGVHREARRNYSTSRSIAMMPGAGSRLQHATTQRARRRNVCSSPWHPVGDTNKPVNKTLHTEVHDCTKALARELQVGHDLALKDLVHGNYRLDLD